MPVFEERATGSPVTLTNGRFVLPDRVLDGGSITVEDGLIATIGPDRVPDGAHVVDLDGMLVLPGLVCLHNDAIEREVNPRPGANFPIPFAVRQLDRRLAAAGVTTQFHALSFSEQELPRRSVTFAGDLARAVNELQRSPERTIDHFPLLRCDLRCPTSLETLLEALEDSPIPLVSLNDHVPGKGQYRDVGAFREYVSRDLSRHASRDDIEGYITAALDRVAATQPIVEATLARLPAARDRHHMILVSHDDDTAEMVDAMWALGCRVAEFPLTVEAAWRARELGMHVVMGAPNLLRGGSLSGNASTADLIARGLVDVLVADYYAPALLVSVLRAVASGLCDLPTAVRMVTANPAAAVGLDDRGSLSVGLRADLVVVEELDAGPLAWGTMVAGRWAYLTHGRAMRAGAMPAVSGV